MALDDNALVTWEKTQSILGLEAGDQAKYESLINAASAVANKYTGRKLSARDYIVRLDGNGKDEILLPEFPVNSVTSVFIDTAREFGSESEITDYVLYEEEGSIYYEGKFPDDRKCVQIAYNAGFPADSIPEDIQIAVVEIVAWMAHRLSDNGTGVGIRQFNEAGGGTIEYEMNLPLSAQRKLDPYVRREYDI